jgi:hypothetical protein
MPSLALEWSDIENFAQGVLITAVGVGIALIVRALRRTDPYIDIVTDQLLRRRPGHEMDRERLMSWVRTTLLFPMGVGWIFVALGIASVVVGLSR